MRRTLSLLTAAALLALPGCDRLHFLRPLHAPEDIVQEPLLVGEWRDQDKSCLSIEAADDHYIFKSGGDFRANVWLLRLGAQLYADVAEDGPGIPDHQFLRVEISGDELRLEPLNTGWALEQVKANALPFERVEQVKGKDRRYVVTAESRQLQLFLLANAAAAWDEPVVLRRVQ